MASKNVLTLHSFWSHFKFISETDNGIEFELQINYGPEWNVEFLIPM